MLPVVLTIAGSDSGGGAGVQADLKTLSALGCFGISAFTTLTAQNPDEVRGIHPVPPLFVRQQIETLLAYFHISAIKIGMVHTPEVIEVLHSLQHPKIVLDPVMMAQSGGSLTNTGKTITHLFPLVELVTPNLHEASALLGREINQVDQMETAAQELIARFKARAVLLKGGHLCHNKGWDCVLVAGRSPLWLKKETILSTNTHGTGCTYSSSIAAYLAHGFSLIDAICHAKEYLHGALIAGKNDIPGKSLDHFWRTSCML